MFDLTGRVAVVTGASAGLGRQLALALGRQGANVAILARRRNKLEEVAQEVRALGVKCLAVCCDVTSSAQVEDAYQAVMAEYGTVDILVNNAGGGAGGALTEIDDETWQKTMNLNLNGTFFCMRAFGKEMLKKGYGRVINLGSILGQGGLPELPVLPYHTVKGGLINLTRGAASEWATKGITVNALCPGFFPSESNGPDGMNAMEGFIRARTPLGRPGMDGELDSSVIYLAADESSYVTGMILFCDGGWTCV